MSDHQAVRYFYVPTSGAEDWRKLLADPGKHWRSGFSARSLAYAWETAKGFPPEVFRLFTESGVPAFQSVELLLAIPEHKVFMPPYSGHPSQNDLFALARDGEGDLIAITVEGKVAESFDKTLGEWNAENSRGKAERLKFIKERLGLGGELPSTIRYQLLHRTTSAIVEAQRFNARSAVMVVHSFSQSDQWFEDYRAFTEIFGVPGATVGRLHFLTDANGLRIYSGWARGEERFLQM